MKTIIVSDAHLKNNKSLIYNKFCNFILSLEEKKIDNLILLGDIFDVLYQNPREVYYYKLYQVLKILHLSGVKIYYLYGNHDFNFNFKKYSFIKTYEKLENFKIATYNSYIYHGDGLNKKDYKYLFLKKILRSSACKYIYNILSEGFFYYLASLVSNISRKTKIYKESKIYDLYKSFAKNLLEQKLNINLVVLAHIHVAGIEVFDNSKYVNTGSFAKDGTYISVDEHNINIEKFI